MKGMFIFSWIADSSNLRKRNVNNENPRVTADDVANATISSSKEKNPRSWKGEVQMKTRKNMLWPMQNALFPRSWDQIARTRSREIPHLQFIVPRRGRNNAQLTNNNIPYVHLREKAHIFHEVEIRIKARSSSDKRHRNIPSDSPFFERLRANWIRSRGISDAFQLYYSAGRSGEMLG